MPSKTDLANISLSLLGEEAIPLSFSDATVASKEVLKLYQHGLEIELSGHSWDFAKRRAVLAPLQEKPLFGWKYMYELPSDFLTIHMVDGESNYVIEGSKMLTDQSNSLSIIYMTRDVDPNEYHPLFIEVFTTKLAFLLCEKLTHSEQKKSSLYATYKYALERAYNINAISHPHVVIPQVDWIGI